MKPGSWGCFRAAVLLALALVAGAADAQAAAPAPTQAQLAGIFKPQGAELVADQQGALLSADVRGKPVELPYTSETGSHWFRIEFEVSAPPAESWAVYLPYFYGGGELRLNGVPLARIASSGAGITVRWERPYLVPIPDSLLKTGSNILMVRPDGAPVSKLVRMTAPEIGAQSRLVPGYERRSFLVRTMPQFTVLACLVVAALVLSIWLRRREESLYGLFGLAALLWGARTVTFVVESLPTQWWPAWRMLYHSATGGFIVVLMVFSLRLAGSRHRWLEWSLFGFWLLGPVGFILSGGNETLLGRIWSGGLIPIGLGILVMSAVAAWRQRTVNMTALTVAIALAVAAGVNDYLLASNSPLLHGLAPKWTAQRIFLLHYAADALLLVMGAILSTRFITALQDRAQLNQTLESRVADRELALGQNYTRMAGLERQHAADEERQRIMRDLHDGLGSQLFLTLARVEASDIGQEGIAQALRDCIADMRLALEALSPNGNDFLQAWSNFRFRWEHQLDTIGIRSSWPTETEDEVLDLSPHAGLQLLRIAQEALTNVLKHAQASQVEISLRQAHGQVQLRVSDDGIGMARSGRPGRGLANMRTRAAHLGGRFDLEATGRGTRLQLSFPPPTLSQPAVLA